MDPEPKQFKLTDEGVIFFQPDPTNPLPGKPVGKIRKGEALLRPEAEADGGDFDNIKLTEHLHGHINEILQPLAALQDGEAIQEPARNIADKLHGALGILPRSELEEPIAGLDEAGRSALRARKVRLGPVLVFLPLLNKPAAVRLRALLWNVWYDKPLPAAVPPDGVTSVSVEAEQDLDKAYFRSIGYPVYGPRAIRVDMLDRLICEVYDSADKGVFKAQHKMAEWLGCNISDLYSVLEAMGHRKIHDPADGQKPEEGEAKAEEKPAEKVKAEEPTAEKPKEEVKAEENAEEKTEGTEEKKEPVLQEKPELATFRLRKGRAYGEQSKGRKSFKGKQDDPKKRKHKPVKKHKGKPRGEPKERIITAAAPKKDENASPFAALKDLKVQGKD